jgi:molybdate transport system substrate-binding protein
MRILMLAAIWAAQAAAAAAQPLTVSAASSVADVVHEAGRAWATAGGAGVRVNAGGSNVLARQIAAGAGVDVFLSADHAQMQVAEKSGRLVPGSIRDLLSNTLVVVVPPGSGLETLQPKQLAGPGLSRIALGNPDSVPAGVYARQWLERIGLWPSVAGKVVPTLTARAALAAVRAGRVDAGVVFATDARTMPDVKVAHVVDGAEAPDITYPVAVVRGPREAEAARFVEFLFSPAGREIFTRAGFRPAAAPAHSPEQGASLARRNRPEPARRSEREPR